MKIKDIMYERNATLYDVKKIPVVHVVGCGGIGSWAAISFAMAGAREIHVYDNDTLGVNNLNRLPFSLKDVGEPKTTVVKEFIQRVRPDCKVVTHRAVAKPKDLAAAKKGHLVVICVDNAKQNNIVLDACRKGVRTLRGAYNEDRVTVTDGLPQWGKGDGTDKQAVAVAKCEERPVQSYIAPPLIVAALLVEKALRKPDIEVASTQLSKLGSR